MEPSASLLDRRAERDWSGWRRCAGPPASRWTLTGVDTDTLDRAESHELPEAESVS
jgi:hypothetical protein